MNRYGLGIHICYENQAPQTIRSDPDRLRQLLLLLDNAIKFTEQGSVTLTVTDKSENHQMLFTVSDTGIGMQPSQLQAVRQFKAFSQADRSLTRRYGGVGLGLRLAKAITVCLGGSLQAESEPGRGSTFTAAISTSSQALQGGQDQNGQTPQPQDQQPDNNPPVQDSPTTMTDTSSPSRLKI